MGKPVQDFEDPRCGTTPPRTLLDARHSLLLARGGVGTYRSPPRSFGATACPDWGWGHLAFQGGEAESVDEMHGLRGDAVLSLWHLRQPKGGTYQSPMSMTATHWNLPI